MLVEIDFLVHKFPLYNCLRMIYKKKELMIIFFVYLHQDVVLGDHLVVGEKCLFYKTFLGKWEMLTKNYDDWSISGWEIEERRFHHNIPCEPSPWCCSWGSSDGRNESHKSPILMSMIDLQRKKNYEDVLCRASPGCCSRGSQGVLWWLERKVSLEDF